MSDSKKCAYCDSSGQLTREHLWPATLHRRRREADGDDRGLFWLRRTGTEIPSEVKIRDVCATCNNVHLSALDDYIARLFERSLVDTPQRHDRVVFEYEYHRLKRWLLKVCFNSARVHTAGDLFAFRPLRPYILGKADSLGKSVQLYVQLLHPEEVPLGALIDPADAPVTFLPTDLRVGHLWFVAPGVGKKLLRAIHLRSYAFFMAFFEPGAAAAVREEFTRHILDRLPNAALLKASQKSVPLVCNGLGAWQSYEGSRENSFYFGEDAE